MKFDTRIIDQEDSAEYSLIIQSLRDYNSSQVKRDMRPLTIALFDHNQKGDQKLVAGLNGATYFGWLYVEHLWVREDCRKHGIGKKLILQAEDEAKKRGCKNVYLDTFSFQAPEFYKRLGFEEYAKFEDMPEGHTRYFFRKTL